MNIRRPGAPDIDGIILLAHGSPEAPQWPRHEYERILLAGARAAQEPQEPQELALRRFPLLAELAGTLAGFALTSWLPGEKAAVLETIIVHRNYRRRGFGKELLFLSMFTAQKAGASAMRLEVRASNAAAQALYLGQNFRQTGRRRAYYSAPVEDALLLEKVFESFPDGMNDGVKQKC